MTMAGMRMTSVPFVVTVDGNVMQLPMNTVAMTVAAGDIVVRMVADGEASVTVMTPGRMRATMPVVMLMAMQVNRVTVTPMTFSAA